MSCWTLCVNFHEAPFETQWRNAGQIVAALLKKNIFTILKESTFRTVSKGMKYSETRPKQFSPDAIGSAPASFSPRSKYDRPATVPTELKLDSFAAYVAQSLARESNARRGAPQFV